MLNGVGSGSYQSTLFFSCHTLLCPTAVINGRFIDSVSGAIPAIDAIMKVALTVGRVMVRFNGLTLANGVFSYVAVTPLSASAKASALTLLVLLQM